MGKWNKTIALLLSLLLCSTIMNVAIAAETSILETSELYDYNKFEKEWKIIGWYTYKYSDGIFGLGICFFDAYLDGFSPELRTYINYDTGESVAKITEINILLDDAIYHFGSLEPYEDGFSYQFGGNVLRHFLSVLPVSKEIAIQYKYDSGEASVIDDISPSDMSELIEMGELLENAGIWEACHDVTAIVDTEYDASIDGEVPSDEEIEKVRIEINATQEPTPKPTADAILPQQTTAESSHETTSVPTYPLLQKGDRNDEVKTLQLRLIELNYLDGGADGDFGNKTKAAMELFQSSAKLPVTGIADQETQQALYADNAPKAKVYKSLNFKELSRNPDQHIGEYYSFSGQVIQALESSNWNGTTSVTLRIATKSWYDDVVMVTYMRQGNDSRILEDDKVTVKGEYKGIESYTAVMGNTVTVPLFDGELVTLR